MVTWSRRLPKAAVPALISTYAKHQRPFHNSMWNNDLFLNTRNFGGTEADNCINATDQVPFNAVKAKIIHRLFTSG